MKSSAVNLLDDNDQAFMCECGYACVYECVYVRVPL